jgi:tetratricopeptide (TPR) repeat protein
MRIIIFLFFLFCASECALPQITPANKTVKPPTKTEMPSKTEIQSQMSAATNEIRKELTDLEKQIASSSDEKEIKDLKEQADVLKKQLSMMEGLNKNMAGMSEKVVKEAANEQGAVIAPKRDVTRISVIPKKTLSDAELLLFVRNVHSGVERLISPAERTESLNIYNETKSKYRSNAAVANAANGCWMLGHWEKALFIMGKVCIDDLTDADNLNNYAAFLVMTGAEQAAIPILEYLNEKYSDNSTILNNLGQAWFGLGEMEKAKKYLDSATLIYPNHSMANSTLSGIAVADHNTPKAISYLKASLKENYDPEKEGELAKLGYAITYADMPEFKYPMKADPLGIQSLVESIPEDYPTRIGDDQTVDVVNRYVGSTVISNEQFNEENIKLSSKLQERGRRLSDDSGYRREFLDPHNCPAYKLAARSRLLIWTETFGSSSPLITQLWLPSQKYFANIKTVKTGQELWSECQDIWTERVAKPTADLARAWKASNRGNRCSDIDAATEAYLAKKNQIRKQGVQLIKKKVREYSKELDLWVRISLYSVKDDPPKNAADVTMDLVSELEFTTARSAYRNGELSYFLSMAQEFVEKQSKLRSSCSPTPEVSEDDPLGEIVPLVRSTPVYPLKCEFKKVLNTPVVVYKFECNTMKETTKRNLKPKKDPVNRGQGQGSARSNAGGAPLAGGRGPSNFGEYDVVSNANQKPAPLNAENKELSQFSIEYDRSGNLVGLNVQVNEAGTELADPKSSETEMDSRWSWNAIASPKKGFLNKLLMK